MPDIILHHFNTSPYAEKIRLIFGYKNLAWKSVLVPNIMPSRSSPRSPAVIGACQ